MSAATAGSLDQGRTDADPGATSTKGRRGEQGGSSPVDEDTESVATSQPPKRGLQSFLRASQRVMMSVVTGFFKLDGTKSDDTDPPTPLPEQGPHEFQRRAFSPDESTVQQDSMSRDKPATEATVVERSIEREMQASQKQRQEPVSRQESKTDAVAPEQSFERGMQPTSLQQDQIPRQDSETDEVVEEGGIKREVEPALQQQDTRSREESETEEIVEEGGITPGMQRTFVSKRHGFRLHVQGGGVPDKQISGPITVTPLKESFMFEGVKLEGVLEVRCLPAGCQFDRPLLFDFPVEGRSKGCPVIDELGRIGYEVLTKDCSSNIWVRDPEHSNPLEIVKDIQGKIYVRAQVHHFSCWSLFQKQTPVDLGNQKFKQERIPRMQQKRHQSVIKNDRDGGVTIHVYAMRMSQWSAALESADVEASVASVAGGHVRLGGGVRRQDAAAASMPQMVTIEPGGSHWLEIPRIGTGLWSSRKAVVAIVTAEEPVHDDGRGGNEKMRLEVLMHLRCKTMLTVKLPVGEDNKVKGLPVTRGEGGILPMLMNVILSYGKAMSSSSGSSSSATTELSRGRPSGTTSTTSSGPTTGTDYAGRRLEAFQASMEEPDAATRALSAANDRPAATSPGANVSSTSTVTDRPATSCRGRHTSSASTCCCAPPADSADFPTIS